MKLQVEEDACTGVSQGAHESWTLEGEQPAPDLEAASQVAKRARELEGAGPAVDVERHEQPLVRVFNQHRYLPHPKPTRNRRVATALPDRP